MEFRNAYIRIDHKDVTKLIAMVDIDVPGLGVVKFDHGLSEDLCQRVRQEAELALKLKMGIKE